MTISSSYLIFELATSVLFVKTHTNMSVTALNRGHHLLPQLALIDRFVVLGRRRLNGVFEEQTVGPRAVHRLRMCDVLDTRVHVARSERGARDRAANVLLKFEHVRVVPC